MNWGYRILFFYLAFVGGIIFLVYKSSQHTTVLVAENYYEKELQYQQVIDSRKNTQPYEKEMSLVQDDQEIILQLPISVGSSIKTGELEFVCLNDNTGDKKLVLQTGTDGRQYLDKRTFKKGNYRLQVSWVKQNVPYFYEYAFMID